MPLRASSSRKKYLDQTAKPPSDDLLDRDCLNDFAFGDAWCKYFPATAGDTNVERFEGMSTLLAKNFSFKIADLPSHSTISFETSRLRSRSFGELISSSVLEADAKASEDVDGAFLKSENCIIVMAGVAIAPRVLLFLAAYATPWLCSDLLRINAGL